MHTLESQYRALAELKEIDERVHLVERDCERIPEEVKQFDDAILTKRGDLDQAKTQFAEAEKKLRATERELKEREDSLFKAEGKMMEVKTNVEYQAAIKENQTQKQGKAVLEDRVLQLIAALEEQKKALVGIEAEFKTHEQEILVKKKVLTDEHEKLIRQLETLLKQRTGLTENLDDSTATLYRKIVATGKIAVAVAEKGRCLGCNLQVRAQIYNEILGAKAIHRCANCGRLLIATKQALEAASHPGELAAK